MNALIPAVCENQRCGTIFLMTNAFGIPPGATSYLSECRMGPCPKCGGMGLIPSGHYTNSGTHTWFDPETDRDRQSLERAMALLHQAINTNMSATAFMQAAQEKTPELSALWDLVPKNQEAAYKFWTLILAAIGAILIAYKTFQSSAPTELVLPKEIIDAIRSSRDAAPDSGHNQRLARGKAKKGRRGRRS